MNFDRPFISDNTITDLLNQKVEIEQKLEKQLKEKGFSHFSSKKFVGDLGEYYATINLSHLFETNTLKVADISNANNDINGKLKLEVAKQWELNQVVKIEVKTRYFQQGSPQLFGLNANKFDLLVFVSLNKDYSCHFIGIIRKTELKVDKQNRISFTNYLDKLIYPKNIKFEKHK